MEVYPNGGHFKWLMPWVRGRELRTAIDCGGHKGMWSVHWTKLVKNIEAFEPNPEILPIFKKRTAGMDNITLHEVALGDKPGKVSMQYETHPGTFHVKDNTGTIEMRTLDSYNFTDVDIIKIDVEGYEVRCAESFIDRTRLLHFRRKLPSIANRDDWVVTHNVHAQSNSSISHFHTNRT